MYRVSAAYLAAIRGPHKAYGYIEAWRGGARVTVPGPDGAGTRLPMTDGAVTVDGATPGVRRTLTATFAPVPGLWDALAPIGTELRAYTVLEYPNGQTETVAQGVFDIDSQTIGYATNGDLKVTAPDRWARIQRARFLTPRGFGGGTVRARIAALLTEALPAGTVVADRGTSTDVVPIQTVDRDRDKLIQDLAAAASLDVYFDRDGGPVIRDAPTLSTTAAVWTVNEGIDGTMTDAERERNRQQTYNVVVATSDRNDGGAVVPAQVAWDNDASSPTYAGPGAGVGPLTALPALSTAGPFGQRPGFYSSPLITTAAQAQTAALTQLRKATGLAAQLTLTSVANPALEDGDTLRVVLPPDRRGVVPPVEWHIIDSLTVPLVPSRNAQQITTRSTRADDDTLT